MLARLMQSQIWLQLAGSVVAGGLEKGTVASAHLDARHFSHYATCAFQGATLVLELRGSESE